MRKNKARLFVSEVIAGAFAFNRGLLFKSQLVRAPSETPTSNCGGRHDWKTETGVVGTVRVCRE